jgi:hypothetical protein
MLRTSNADNRGHRNSSDACSIRSNDSSGKPFTAPIVREIRQTLGRSGTLGGSDISGYTESQLDASDPDSDVPDELKFILAARPDTGSIVESLSSRIPTPTFVPESSALANTSPQTNEPPVFRLTLPGDDDQNGFGIDGESAHSSEEDTKKSFDFTGEIMKLNESGASDRASFVEMAFKTPAKVDLHYDFSTHLRVEVPPLPPPPLCRVALLTICLRFKFGGRPDNTSHDHELTLSDIIPPPEFARAISEASLLDGIEDDSVLRSIYANGQGKYG